MSRADLAPVVFDTSVLIDHLRGRPEAREALTTVRADGRRVCASVVTRTELLGGMRSAERAGTHALIEAIEWFEVDVTIADRAGELARAYRRTHPGVDIADYLIAATVEVLGAELETLNVRHFPMVPDLRAPY